MTENQSTLTPDMKKESFADLLNESFSKHSVVEGSVLKGRIVAIEKEYAIVDVNLKSEGKISLREFSSVDQDPVAVGDEVDVYLERFEGSEGEIVLSREKARREEAWEVLEKAFNATEKVTGVIFGKVKGGFTVDLAGAIAFLPTSQVDIRPIRDLGPLMGNPQPFIILKMDRKRGNIVVSRRSVLEESRAEAKSELISNLSEGQILKGVVKNITDYGAFIDLGGVDGLLHVTDISWRRINHPSEVLQLGMSIDVQVIRFNSESGRISLGMKQLETDPWANVEEKYPVGRKMTGRVTNITDYGAFIELEAGVEGLAHVSEMSWVKKNVHPGKIVATSQEVEVMVLDIESQKRRISLGIKQCYENPWAAFATSHPAGTTLSGEIKNITEFGLFIGLPGDIDGMIHLTDLSWEKSGDQAVVDYKKGDVITVKVLDVDTEKERISLGVKQLTDDPFESSTQNLKKGDVVTCTITSIQDAGLEVSHDGVTGFIKKQDLSRDRSEQRPDRFAVGEKLDAKIMSIERSTRKLTLSIKARELEEEKQAMAEFGSADSGASLGDILGAAISKAKEAKEEKSDD